MATRIIDALLVTLGLDPSDFNRGASDVDRALNRTRKTVVNVSRDIERAINSAARSLALAFLGFNSSAGLIRTLQQLNETARQIGLIGLATGTAARELKKYANAAELAGGSSEGFLETIKKIQKAQYDVRTYGISEDLSRFFNYMQMGSDWANKEPLEIFTKLAEKFQEIAQTQGRPFANSLGLDAGFNQDTMNFLLRGPEAMQEFVAKQEALTRSYEKNAEAAQVLREKWGYLKQVGESQLLTLLRQLQPQLIQLADWITKISSEGVNSGSWAKAIVDGVNSITDAVKQLWQFIGKISDAATTFSNSALAKFIFSERKTETIAEKLGGKNTFLGRLALLTENKQEKAFNSPKELLSILPGSWQQTREQYQGFLQQAEDKYALPRGTLSMIAQRETGWRSDVASGKASTRAGGTGVFGLNPQRFPGAGDAVGDSELVADILDRIFGRTGNWAETLRQFQQYAYPGQGTVLADTTSLAPQSNDFLNLFQSQLPGSGVLQRPSIENSLQIDSMNIYTQATDAAGIAAAADAAIRRRIDTAQADYGMN